MSNCAIVTAAGLAVSLAALIIMLLGGLPVRQGELLFIAGLAIFLGGVIWRARQH